MSKENPQPQDFSVRVLEDGTFIYNEKISITVQGRADNEFFITLNSISPSHWKDGHDFTEQVLHMERPFEFLLSMLCNAVITNHTFQGSIIEEIKYQMDFLVKTEKPTEVETYLKKKGNREEPSSISGHNLSMYLTKPGEHTNLLIKKYTRPGSIMPIYYTEFTVFNKNPREMGVNFNHIYALFSQRVRPLIEVDALKGLIPTFDLDWSYRFAHVVNENSIKFYGIITMGTVNNREFLVHGTNKLMHLKGSKSIYKPKEVLSFLNYLRDDIIFMSNKKTSSSPLGPGSRLEFETISYDEDYIHIAKDSLSWHHKFIIKKAQQHSDHKLSESIDTRYTSHLAYIMPEYTIEDVCIINKVVSYNKKRKFDYLILLRDDGKQVVEILDKLYNGGKYKKFPVLTFNTADGHSFLYFLVKGIKLPLEKHEEKGNK